MNRPQTFAEVIGHLKDVADRWERGEATTQEIRDALIQLDGAKRVVAEHVAVSDPDA